MFKMPANTAYECLTRPCVGLDPRSMNRFLYAESNPWSMVDPSDHASSYEGGGCGPGGKYCGSTGNDQNFHKNIKQVGEKGNPHDHDVKQGGPQGTPPLGTPQTSGNGCPGPTCGSVPTMDTSCPGPTCGSEPPTTTENSDTRTLVDATGYRYSPDGRVPPICIGAGDVRACAVRLWGPGWADASTTVDVGAAVHDVLKGISGITGAGATVLAGLTLAGVETGPLDLVPAAAAGTLEIVSVLTGSIATGADCLNGHEVECRIGLGETAFGLVGPLAHGLNTMMDFGDDVVHALQFSGGQGSGGFSLAGFLNSLFGGH